MNWLSDSHLEFVKIYLEYKSNPEITEDSHKNSIFGMFQVDLEREIKNQFAYLKHSNLQPSEIKDMVYWEWELMLKELEEYIKEEKEQREKEKEEEGSYKDTKEYQRAKSMMGMGSNFGSSIPKIGSFGGTSIKMPNF